MVFDDEDVTKLYKIRRTILQMLADRNYSVSDTELSMSRKDFKSEFGEHFRREQLEIQKTHKDDPSERVCVFFFDEAKLGVGVVKSITNRMGTENFTRGILVCQKPFSPQAKTAVATFNNFSASRLEVFLEADLIVNITKHEKVPEHQVLTNAEKKALLKRYTVKEEQLPKILITDPIARYYGLSRGQVVRIIRPSETAGRYITYRIVGS
ncbi:DNA-directed RNA polymerases II and IV subunit 5A-like [Trifolium pratense]|uniref:Uncharacterized protein n=1 Tax=Trifolium pratense TaxID=57577 RepID=A0ACB0IY57_TRIPR|nr:DNA-directed RNA polymerases II and IV subunit 5A-like [Trifolium pratense]CAJ2636781.1 unnamed protein product [Trifolium pratense]